ncbi:MAG: glutamate racemase [Pseudomonadota bacterium]
MQSDNRPIGIFDSGIGGLTVFKAIREALPKESLIYLGDTARLPYGTKSEETVTRYAIQNANFLIKRDVKAIVVACNTASAYALSKLRSTVGVPVLGVVEPGSKEGTKATKNKRIGVIATAATVESRAYHVAIQNIDPEIVVQSKSCGLFVPIVEEGMEESHIARLAVEEYLRELCDSGIDTLVLGCTHYPLLKGMISEMFGEKIMLVDSAFATARELNEMFVSGKLLSSECETSDVICVTDLTTHFEMVAKRLLGKPHQKLTKVDL